jgi:flagellar basal body-associated protein FliL
MNYALRKSGREEMSQENNVALPSSPAPKRNMKVIALAIICVILAASLVGVIAFYQPTTTNLQSQIAEKDNTISSLNQTIDYLHATTTNTSVYMQQIVYLEQELSSMNDTLTSAYENMIYYENLTQLQASSILIYQQQGTIANNTWVDAYNNVLRYAGYIVVQATSTTNSTYVETLYSSYRVNFDQNVTLGMSGTAVFPVLPGTVEVRIGNLDQTSAVVTVTVSYYY